MSIFYTYSLFIKQYQEIFELFFLLSFQQGKKSPNDINTFIIIDLNEK